MERVIIRMNVNQTPATCAAALLRTAPDIRDLLDGVRDMNSDDFEDDHDDDFEDDHDDMMAFGWADLQREVLDMPLCGVNVPRLPAQAPIGSGMMSGKFHGVSKPQPAKERKVADDQGSWSLHSPPSGEQARDDESLPDLTSGEAQPAPSDETDTQSPMLRWS